MSASDRSVRVPVGVRALVLVVAWSAATACANAPEAPVAPDVSELLSAYSAPNGTVDTTESASWLEAGALQVDLLGGSQARILLTRVAAAALKAVNEASLPDGNGELVPTRVDGIATLRVRCGSGAQENADVSVMVVDGVISPLMWGTAHACPLWQGIGVRESYDGRFTMYRYPGTDLLVRVEGTLTKAGTDINLDFRLTDGRLETRIPTATGDLIVTRNGAAVMARAANGTFRCNPKQRVCTRDDGSD